jgi:PPOX class probable F420-dependent enzyme
MPIRLSTDLRAFLDQPRTFARIATVGARHAPQVTTMWYRREGDTLRMVCEPNAAKARNIRRNPQVAIVVEHPDDPYRYFQFRGTATIEDDQATADEETRLLAYRYLGQERGDVYLTMVAGDRLVTIIVQVERVTSFVGRNAATASAAP